MKRFLTAGNLWLFIKFNFVGIVNTLIDYMSFGLLNGVFSVEKYTANVIAFLIAGTNSFFCNSLLVYKEKRLTARKYVKFLVGNSSALIVSSLVILLLTDGFGVPELISKLAAAPVSVVMNFTIQRFMLFKKSADSEEEKLTEKTRRFFKKDR